MQELTPEHIRGRASSLISLQWGISGILGPAIAGSMIGNSLDRQWVLVMIIGSLIPVPLFIKVRKEALNSRNGHK